MSEGMTASLSLLLRAEGYFRSMRQVQETTTRATRAISRDVHASSRSVEGLGKSAERMHGRMRGALGVVGLGGMGFALKDLVQGGLEAQTNMTQLRAALKATGQGGGEAAAKLKEFSESLSVRGGFEAQLNIKALSQFVGQTHSATKATGMLQLATNIARGTHRDLGETVQMVAKAYNGQARGLQTLLGPMVATRSAAVGMSMAHQQVMARIRMQASLLRGPAKQAYIEQALLANHLTAQELQLAQLQDKRISGQQALAAAMRVFGNDRTSGYARTTQGRLEALQNRWKIVIENLGTNLLPVVDRLAKYTGLAVHWFEKLPKPTREVVAGMVLLAPVLSGLGFIAKSYRGAVTLLLWPLRTLRAALFGVKAGEETAAKTSRSAAGSMLKLTEAADVAAAALARLAEIGALSGGRGLGGKGAGAGADVVAGGWASRYLGKIPGASRLLGFGKLASKALLKFGIPLTIAGTLVNHIGALHRMIGHIPIAGGPLNSAFSVLGFARGGVVPRYMASGGPIGTDTVPAWLTPGEGVITRQGMQSLGAGGLASLNRHGSTQAWNKSGSPGGEPDDRMVAQVAARPDWHAPNGYVVQPVSLQIGGREVTRAVIRQVLNDAARGPTSMVGGSLATGGHPAFGERIVQGI